MKTLLSFRILLVAAILIFLGGAMLLAYGTSIQANKTSLFNLHKESTSLKIAPDGAELTSYFQLIEGEIVNFEGKNTSEEISDADSDPGSEDIYYMMELENTKGVSQFIKIYNYKNTTTKAFTVDCKDSCPNFISYFDQSKVQQEVGSDIFKLAEYNKLKKGDKVTLLRVSNISKDKPSEVNTNNYFFIWE